MPDGLFSVVVMSYNRGELWKQAVDSILSQDYPEIELVLADDGSEDFDKAEAERYIRGHADGRLKRLVVLADGVNVGTVANLRKAHKHCTGRYLTHIAGDDVLFDGGVLSRYAEALENKEADVLGVYGDSLLCDEELEPTGESYFDREEALRLNGCSADELFKKLADRCCIPMGATAFIREEFLAQGDFDERYRLIEDWPFFVRTVCGGRRYIYIKSPALLYRAGGVSRSEGTHPEYLRCRSEHLKIYENEIIPNLWRLDKQERLRQYYTYSQQRIDLAKELGVYSEVSRMRVVLRCPGLAVQCLIYRMTRAKRVTLAALLLILLAVFFVITKRIGYIPIAVAAIFALYSFTGFLISAARFCRYFLGHGA